MINNDTIFALSSGIGISGVYVIRISGQNLYDIALSLTNRKKITPRYSYFVNLKDENKQMIDSCLIVYFKAPHSFTGEDIIEIYSHGSIAIKNKIFSYLSLLNMRLAEKGEFTKRAFLNNKINLLETDGLISLLNAKTEQQRIYALNTLNGQYNNTFTAWKDKLIEILAYTNATMDYSEEDLPFNIQDNIIDKTINLLNEIEKVLKSYSLSKGINDGFTVVLNGKTNVGKSSLFNKLAGESLAIVSDIEGTTRDVLRTQLNINGFLVNLYDTAGVRNTNDILEKIGIEKTNKTLQKADIIIKVFDIKDNVTDLEKDNEIFVFNKADLQPDLNKKIAISTITGDGIDQLLKEISKKLEKLTENIESKTIITDRVKLILENTVKTLKLSLDNKQDLLIYSEYLNKAKTLLCEIFGNINSDEIENKIFSQLCLGK